jgi:hypothetical protein
MAMHKTEWREFHADRIYRIRAEYGADEQFAARHNQAPHFTITGETQEQRHGRWADDSGGCIHDQIATHFPELAPLIKWHLFSVGKGPMHYIANAIYWWEHAMGVRTFQYPHEWQKYGSPHEAGIAHFKSTIVFGALPDDVLPHEGTAPNKVREWLEARLPRLLEAFEKETAAYR